METTESLLLGKNIHRLDVCIGRRLEKDEEGLLPPEVTGGNGRIIRFLLFNEDRDIFQKDLEKEFGITPSTASRVLHLMEKKDLVERLSVDGDARLKKLRVTPKGRVAAELMAENFARVNRQLLKGFTQEEILLLDSMIQRLQNNITEQRSEENL